MQRDEAVCSVNAQNAGFEFEKESGRDRKREERREKREGRGKREWIITRAEKVTNDAATLVRDRLLCLIYGVVDGYVDVEEC